MLRMQYSRFGGPEVLAIVDVPPGIPGDGEVRVRVRAASVNPVDWKIRAGALRMMTGSRFPRGMGQDFAGTVEAVGPGVTRVKVGDEVFGAMEMKRAAAFAEAIVTPERTMTVRPSTLAFDQAAALGTVGQTAWTALVDVGTVKAGQRVFVNGCLGGVGRCAVQIGRMFGAEVSGTCGQAGLGEARALGVGDPVDYGRFDAESARGRFDLILDTAGNLTVTQCSRMLRGKGLALHINPTFGKMLRVMLSSRNKLVFLKTDAAILAKVAGAAAEGRLVLPIAKVVPLADAIAAIRDLETGGTPKGKVLIAPA